MARKTATIATRGMEIKGAFMHAFSIVTLGIFVAGYSTARWDLTTRLYELAIFAWDHGVVARVTKGFAILSLFFFLLVLPFARLATEETDLVGAAYVNCD
ncbi:hypothetical protein C7974DRAFT_411087 [Boeremia exigua]|uniref:uncharacterized protein n=1 Tax=Boeremia exigua TaxID=749465 RepID=UPI001E8E96F8|nr:uncharacterized protein C7974DRAFT_411087 [Boeremia exigua]KAH6637615.1 hypothetical protein C7974DRAFT_411087 [Boeremia exigua]